MKKQYDKKLNTFIALIFCVVMSQLWNMTNVISGSFYATIMSTAWLILGAFFLSKLIIKND